MNVYLVRVSTERSSPLQKYAWVAKVTPILGVEVQRQELIDLGMLAEGRCRLAAAFVDADESASSTVLPTNTDPTVASIKTYWLPRQTLDQLSFPRRDV